MRTLGLCFCVFAVTALPCASAHAQPIRLHLSAAAARAMGGHQEREFGWGVAALPAFEYGLTPVLGLQLEPSVVWLSEGKPPLDPNFVPEGQGAALSAILGVRLRPFAASHDGTPLSPAGFWLAAGGGATRTNDLLRPAADVQIGYDFLDARGKTGFGPMLGLFHVFQPEEEIRPADANLLLVGLHALYDFGDGVRGRSDRDGDGIYDEDDGCPDQPEDRDAFEDADGCPDLDDDGDGIPDTIDRCPRVPEDKDGFEDGDGCPEPDNDKDGIPDAKDKCPTIAEDKDGFEDEDGCPDVDNDKDGIPDVTDLCPFEPETVNEYADSDGCPDEDQVRVVGNNIVLDDRVHFMVNSHIIRRESHGLLSRLGKLIKEHPEYVHISIEGHADERGEDSFNQPLSERRANAVLEFLVKSGVARERLSSVGYGEHKPRSAKKTELGYYQNRRVEFIITREDRALPKQTTLPATPEALGIEPPKSGAAEKEKAPTPPKAATPPKPATPTSPPTPTPPTPGAPPAGAEGGKP